MDRLLLLEAEERRARADALMSALNQQQRAQIPPTQAGDANMGPPAAAPMDNSASLASAASNPAYSMLPSSSLLLAQQAQQQQQQHPQASLSPYLNKTPYAGLGPQGNAQAQVGANPMMMGPPMNAPTTNDAAAFRQLILQQQQQESLALQAAQLSRLSQGVQLFQPQGLPGAVSAAGALVQPPGLFPVLENQPPAQSQAAQNTANGDVFKTSTDALLPPSSAASSPSSNRPTKREHFPEKLLRLLLDADRDPKLWQVLHFSKDGTALEIHDPAAFERDIIPRYFRHGRLCSFKRQLNLYGFQRLHAKKKKPLAFSHPDFSRNKPDSCLMMDRVNVSKAHANDNDNNSKKDESKDKNKNDEDNDSHKSKDNESHKSSKEEEKEKTG